MVGMLVNIERVVVRFSIWPELLRNQIERDIKKIGLSQITVYCDFQVAGFENPEQLFPEILSVSA
jgi:hypothetical protein